MTPRSFPFSLETKRVLKCAAEEANRQSHDGIETAHLLLGILREERSAAASILMEEGMRRFKMLLRCFKMAQRRGDLHGIP